MPVNDMHPSKICCFSKTQNCERKLLAEVFNCLKSLNEAYKYVCVSLEVHCKNHVIMHLQRNRNIYPNVSEPFISVNQ
jgi:hypothetical protein